MTAEASEPALELDDIQGNIFPGFKKDNQHFLFFRLGETQAARPWIASLAKRASTARQVLLSHALWKAMRAQQDAEPQNIQFVFTSVAFTADALRRLGKDLSQFQDDAFREGLTADRAGLLCDPADPQSEGAPQNWVIGGSAERLADVLVIMASDDLAWLEEETAKVVADAQFAGVHLIHRDRGAVLPGAMAGHEHFGFKDGISEPALRGCWPGSGKSVAERKWPVGGQFDELRQDYASPGQPLVWPGRFLFGYPLGSLDEPRLPSMPVPSPDWARNGSFLVYRRLRQDVAAFHAFVDGQVRRLAAAHPTLKAERLGALFVGRWASGTPVMRSPDADMNIDGDAANYFQFAEATTVALPGDTFPLGPGDRGGDRCPLGAHIRKVNPRDQETDKGPARRTLLRLLLRRGIPFDNSPAKADDVGLLFVAYQTSIEDQFEFLTTDWVNEANRPRAGGGTDPLLAAGIAGASPIMLQLDGKPEAIAMTTRYVTPTGGAYMFAPSIALLKEMGNEPA